MTYPNSPPDTTPITNGKLEAAGVTDPVEESAATSINPDKVIAKPFKNGTNTAAVTPAAPVIVPERDEDSCQPPLNQIRPNAFVPLDQLAKQVCESRQAAQKAGAALLHHVLNAGDALNEAQKRVPAGWKQWLRNNCFLSVRTAFVYQQLADHREEIEAVLSQAGELSLRAALRLISTSKHENEEEDHMALLSSVAFQRHLDPRRGGAGLRGGFRAGLPENPEFDLGW